MTNAQIFWYIVFLLLTIYLTYELGKWFACIEAGKILKYGAERWETIKHKDIPSDEEAWCFIFVCFLWFLHLLIVIINVIPPFNAWLNSL